MQTALLIHGYNGIPKIFEYCQTELQKLNYKVIMPSLPIQRKISFTRWEAELANLPIPPKVSVVIAHSIGNEFMIRYSAKHHLEIDTYIGLAGFVESFVHDDREDLNKVVAKMQCTRAEINRFKDLSKKRYAIYSDNDHIVPFDILRNFPVAISAAPILIPNIGHMGSKSGLTELPEVIELIK